MIEINLLPSAGKKKKTTRKSVDLGAIAAGASSRFRDKFLIGTVLAVVGGAATGAGLYTQQMARESELTERKDRAVRDSTRYATFLKDRYRAEAIRDTLLREVNIIRSLDDDRFVWPHVLDEVSRALPQYTWLTTLAFTGAPQGSNNVVIAPKEDPATAAKSKNKAPKRLVTEIPRDQVSMRLVGRTVDIQALTRFMKDLAASPYLTNVQLEKSELALDQGKEVTQFQLTVGYRRPDTMVVHRVPLNLSDR
jgi:Tfp pilus assembly protein PilN